MLLTKCVVAGESEQAAPSPHGGGVGWVESVHSLSSQEKLTKMYNAL